MLKQVGNRLAADVIGHVFEMVHLVAMLHHVAVLFQQGDAFRKFLALQDDQSSEFGRNRRRSVDLVHDQAQGRGVHEIEDVIQRGREAVNVLAVKRCDE